MVVRLNNLRPDWDQIVLFLEKKIFWEHWLINCYCLHIAPHYATLYQNVWACLNVCEAGRSGNEELKKCPPPPFPCSPTICECSWKKTQIEKEKHVSKKTFRVGQIMRHKVLQYWAKLNKNHPFGSVGDFFEKLADVNEIYFMYPITILQCF